MHPPPHPNPITSACNCRSGRDALVLHVVLTLKLTVVSIALFNLFILSPYPLVIHLAHTR